MKKVLFFLSALILFHLIVHWREIELPSKPRVSVKKIAPLPIINLNFKSEIIADLERPGWLTIQEGEVVSGPFAVALKLGGNTAKNHKKKRFNFQFADEKRWTRSIKRSILGLRFDDDFILDATFADFSGIRNIVSHEIFSKFRHFQGIQGRFVEVYVNETYQGLYVLSDRYERNSFDISSDKRKSPIYSAIKEYRTKSQWRVAQELNKFYLKAYLDLKSLLTKDRFEKSVIYKGRNGRYDFSAHSAHQFIQKYPKKQNLPWATNINELVNFVSNSSDEEFKTRVWTYFDKSKLLDYLCFIFLTAGKDNIISNFYLIRNDGRYFFAPWDLDNTFGNRRTQNRTTLAPWNGWRYEKSLLFRRILEHFGEDVFAHWENLIAGPLAVVALQEEFSKQYEMIANTGAFKRDEALWKKPFSAEEEVSHILEWIPKRILYVTEKLKEGSIK